MQVTLIMKYHQFEPVTDCDISRLNVKQLFNKHDKISFYQQDLDTM